MAHRLQLFVGHLNTLCAYRSIADEVRVYALSADAKLFVLPLSDDLHDAFHAAYGTGEWLDSGPRLSTGDMAFAARVSQGSALAYLETDYFAGIGAQSAALWEDGLIRVGPITMTAEEGQKRSRTLWPINMTLRTLGINVVGSQDGFEAIGFASYRSNEDIRNRAIEITGNF